MLPYFPLGGKGVRSSGGEREIDEVQALTV